MKRLGIVIVYTVSPDGDYPLVPPDWDVSEHDAGWFTLYPRGRKRPDIAIQGRLMASRGSDAAFLLFATANILKRIVGATSGPYWRSIGELRNDSGPAAAAVKQAWKDMDDSSRPSLKGTLAGLGLIGAMEDSRSEDAPVREGV